MKILCVIDSLGSGGAQRQLVELAKGFKEKGNEVSFLVYHNIIFFKSELDKFKIDVIIVEEKNYFKRILKVRNKITEINPDSILSFLQSTNFITTIAGFPFRKWNLVVGERSANPKILKSFFHLFTDHIVANSTENLRIIKKVNPLLSKKKMSCIYNIIDDFNWNNDYENKNNKENKFIIVIAATYIEHKNTIGLIRAVNLLPLNLKNKLVIEWYGRIGNDNTFQESKKLIEIYNLQSSIFLNPLTKEIKQKYKKADAIGLFSFYEGFPNTLGEGMMMKKPVIASDVSDVSLFIDRKDLLFNPKDVNDIKKSLIVLLNSTKQELKEVGEYNNVLAKKYFNKKEIVNKYLTLLRGKN